jgi:hypothetical protein
MACVAAEPSPCDQADSEVVMQVLTDGSSLKVKSCMNELNRGGVTPEMLSMLDSFLATPDGQALDDIARMAVRNTVLQGFRNGSVKLDPLKYYLDAEHVLRDGTIAAKSDAMSVLAIRDDDRSTILLSEFVDEHGSERLFRSAVATLAMMCVESADTALARASANARLPKDQREFIGATRAQAANFKRGTGWCNF